MLKAKEKEKDGVKLIDYFDEHWYQVDNDTFLPSVTSILGKVIAKGFAFEEWLKNTGNESTYIARKAAESGSKLHTAIEDMLNGMPINALTGFFEKKEWVKLVNFHRWYTELGIKCLETEQITYDIELGYAGTIDFVGIINGEKWLLDWKTGNTIHQEAHQQVAAYVAAYNKLHVEKIQRAAIVHIGAKNRTAKGLCNIGINVIEVDLEEKYKLFKQVLSIYKSLFPDDKAPICEFPLELKI